MTAAAAFDSAFASATASEEAFFYYVQSYVAHWDDFHPASVDEDGNDDGRWVKHDGRWVEQQQQQQQLTAAAAATSTSTSTATATAAASTSVDLGPVESCRDSSVKVVFCLLHCDRP